MKKLLTLLLITCCVSASAQWQTITGTSQKDKTTGQFRWNFGSMGLLYPADKYKTDSLLALKVSLSPATQQIGGIDVSSYIKSGTNVFVDDAVGNTSTLSTTSLTLSTTTGGGNITTGGVNFGGVSGGFGLNSNWLYANAADGSFSINSDSGGSSWFNGVTGNYFQYSGNGLSGYNESGLNQFVLTPLEIIIKKGATARRLTFLNDNSGDNITNFFPDRPGQLATKGDIADSIGNYAKKSGATMTGDLIGYSATPSNALSLVPKSYVDNAITGITWKNSARLATLVNIALSGLGTLDGVALDVDNRVLVKNQTLTSENGIYLAKSGAWVRTTDADSADELNTATIAVERGTNNKNTQWTATSTITTVGTDPITFTQISGSGTYSAGTNMSLSANVFSVVGNPTFTGTVTAPTFSGNLTGNSTTATALANSRTIWGQNFDGTGNITGKLLVSTASASNEGIAVRASSSQTAHLQQWENSAGTILSLISNTGSFRGLNLGNVTNTDNAYITMSTGGLILARNVPDGNAAVNIDLVNPASTGRIVNFKANNINLAYVDRFGTFNSSSLTVNTMLKSDASKNIVSAVPGTDYNALYLSATATLDFPNVLMNQNAVLTVTVTGASVGDVVTLGLPNSILSTMTAYNGTFQAWVSATNTVSIRFQNSDPMSAHDLASDSFNIKILK